MLFDITFLTDLMNGDEDAVRKARELEADLVQQRLSAMTLFELYYGVARSGQSDAERERVEQVLASKPIHPADSAVMRKAGRLAGELSRLQQCYESDAADLACCTSVVRWEDGTRHGVIRRVQRRRRLSGETEDERPTARTNRRVRGRIYPEIERIRENWEDTRSYLAEQDAIVLKEFPSSSRSSMTFSSPSVPEEDFPACAHAAMREIV